MDLLKICGLNLNVVWKNKTENFNLIEKRLKDAVADLFVLPEMFSTGFCMDADDIADQNSESLLWMQSFAKNKNAAITGSVSVKENGHFYNRFYFVKPDGTYSFYNKRHLFSYAGENQIYSAGNQRITVDFKGFRILLQVCYDLRFPVFSRNKKDYDAVLYVANWPNSRIDAWQTLLKARAIENQAYVFGVNRIGTDGNALNYPESSLGFSFDGSVNSIQEGDLVFTEMDLQKLKKYREKFPFLEDEDSFEIRL